MNLRVTQRLADLRQRRVSLTECSGARCARSSRRRNRAQSSRLPGSSRSKSMRAQGIPNPSPSLSGWSTASSAAFRARCAKRWTRRRRLWPAICIHGVTPGGIEPGCTCRYAFKASGRTRRASRHGLTSANAAVAPRIMDAYESRQIQSALSDALHSDGSSTTITIPRSPYRRRASLASILKPTSRPLVYFIPRSASRANLSRIEQGRWTRFPAAKPCIRVGQELHAGLGAMLSRLSRIACSTR